MSEHESPIQPDAHAPLRDDVHLLGEILGDTLRRACGQQRFDLVESLRQTSKDARHGQLGAETALSQMLKGLSADETRLVARAFGQFLNLSNVAEQFHRVRRARAYQVSGEVNARSKNLEAVFGRLREAGHSAEAIASAVSSLAIEFVLTAHPTEVSRRTLLRTYEAIAEQLDILGQSPLPPDRRADALAELRGLVATAWHTDELHRQKPTPVDEAKWGFAVVEHKLWAAVPRFLRRLDRVMRQKLGLGLPDGTAPLRFSSWMGGDRDGNPNVTAAVTREVILLGRWMAADLYFRDVDQLRAELAVTTANAELHKRVGPAREPYRELLREVRARLEATRAWCEAELAVVAGSGSEHPELKPYWAIAELREPIALCYQSLKDVGLDSIAEGRLRDLLWRIDCFGLSLLPLDIRQEAGRHAEVLSAVTSELGLGDYAAWSEAEKQDFLRRELENRRPLIPRALPASPEVLEALATFRLLAEQPRETLGAYVISMAMQPSDVLAVALLQREAGMAEPLPVVPLFETLDALEGSEACIAALLAMPEYRASLDGKLQIMIGYSDSAKDAGFLAAGWAQYQTQERLATLAKAQGVKLTFFHGRGGSVGRGGAPTHAALLSQPPGSVQGRLRITEQGEVIQQKFGLAGVALSTLETYVTATLGASLMPPPTPTPAWRELMDTMAQGSVKAYREVVRENPAFMRLYQAMTPQQELAGLSIGSRPARRSSKDLSLSSLRAIPWIFSWTQVRLVLPTWLGVGEALEAMLKSRQGATLEGMAKQWPFFASQLGMLEMVLAKADPRVARAYMDRLLPAGDAEALALGNELLERFRKVMQYVPQLLNHRELLEENPVIRRSIKVRNPYVDTLNHLQVELLSRTRSGDADPELQDALLLSIAGIAAGMRNTG
ncbi:MAG: phosphoenolpyruvate carboxylase [Gammaproteobacteria bacterium]|nr:phosphoenolpyruvate carboxylase [Gammaproteobacteria bacterium]